MNDKNIRSPRDEINLELIEKNIIQSSLDPI